MTGVGWLEISGSSALAERQASPMEYKNEAFGSLLPIVCQGGQRKGMMDVVYQICVYIYMYITHVLYICVYNYTRTSCVGPR